ncbi:MAG TPA: hypothetical protein VN693_06840 [Rhodanobacteraceae bacterium]|nr:hypothetical protein [Rhodanobacteraceae bacterium]
MRISARRCASIVCLASLLAIAGCGKHVDDNAPLAYAPADTPYLFANFKPAPDDVRKAWIKRSATLMQYSSASYKHIADSLRDRNPDLARVLDQVAVEMADMKSPEEVVKTTGFSQAAHFAIYGIGIAPVARMELADPNAFRALVARMEKSVGHPFVTARLDNQDYWVIGGANDKLHLLLAVEDKQVVATLAPANAEPALLKQLLGLSKPDSSAADTLARIDADHGYTDYGSGYLDLPKLLARISDPKDPVTLAYTSGLGVSAPNDDPSCPAEFASIGAQAPLASFGYQQFEANQIRGSLDISLSAPLRGLLMAMKQPVPGMTAAADSSLLDVVIVLPLQKLQAFWQARAQAVAAQPYKCPSLAMLNQGFQAMANALQQQQLPPQAASILGARFTLDQLVLGSNPAAQTQMAGRFQLASADTASLLGEMQKNLPQLALVDVKADGKPIAVALPPQLQPLAGGNTQAWLAADTHSLALAFGNGEDGKLGDMLKADAGDGSRLMRMHFDGKLYATFADFSDSLAARMPPQFQAQLQQQSQMMRTYAQWLRSADATVSLDDGGLHLQGEVQLTQ